MLIFDPVTIVVIRMTISASVPGQCRRKQ